MDLNQFLLGLLDMVLFVFRQTDNFIILSAATFLFIAALFNILYRLLRRL